MSFILGKFYLPVLRFTEKGRSVFKVYSSRFVFVTYNQFSKRLGGCPALVPGRGGTIHNCSTVVHLTDRHALVGAVDLCHSFFFKLTIQTFFLCSVQGKFTVLRSPLVPVCQTRLILGLVKNTAGPKNRPI